jgi:hypothetical protein
MEKENTTLTCTVFVQVLFFANFTVYTYTPFLEITEAPVILLGKK